MPICTYSSEKEMLINYPKDAHVVELLRELDQLTKSYFVHEFILAEKRWFKKTTEKKLYKVYYHVGGAEFQELLIPTDYVTKDTLLAFLYGLINGLSKIDQKEPIKPKNQNPAGLHQKYYVGSHEPINVDAEYFVLRLDNKAETNHRKACLKAVLAYAEAIKEFLPHLSEDLIKRYK